MTDACSGTTPLRRSNSYGLSWTDPMAEHPQRTRPPPDSLHCYQPAFERLSILRSPVSVPQSSSRSPLVFQRLFASSQQPHMIGSGNSNGCLDGLLYGLTAGAPTVGRSRITSTPASASRTGGAQSAEVTVIYNPQTPGAPHLPAVTVVDMSDV